MILKRRSDNTMSLHQAIETLCYLAENSKSLEPSDIDNYEIGAAIATILGNKASPNCSKEILKGLRDNLATPQIVS